MRWRWCDTRLATVALLAGCVHAAYTPEAGAGRITTAELRQTGDARVRAECPRLMHGSSSATGAAAYTLVIDRSGVVTQARLDRSSGDARMDEIFGQLAARLQFEPPTGMAGPTTRAPVVIGYSCSGATSAITFELREPAGPVRLPAAEPPEGR